MRLNETRNVLWHESCKCVCRLNSSVCNNIQIWNSDVCRCDCNEDFTGIINCTKGHTWNPSRILQLTTHVEYYSLYFYWIIFSTFIYCNCLLLRICLF